MRQVDALVRLALDEFAKERTNETETMVETFVKKNRVEQTEQRVFKKNESKNYMNVYDLQQQLI